MEPETLEARISECGCDHRSPPNGAGRARVWDGGGAQECEGEGLGVACGGRGCGRTRGLRVRPQGRARGKGTVGQQGGGGESLCTGLLWEGASEYGCTHFSYHAVPCSCTRWSWQGGNRINDVPPRGRSLLSFFSHRPLFLPADKATNPLNKDLDWDGINAFCEQLNKELEG